MEYPIAKTWGTVYPLYQEADSYSDRIEVNPTGYCSRHLHTFASNQFTMLEGVLVIIRYWSGRPPTTNTLKAGQSICIPPGYEHRFFSPGESVAMETYFCLHSDERPTRNDITRRDTGGLLNSSDISPLLS